MATILVTVEFPGEIVRMPVLWELGATHDILYSIRRAHVEEDSGWIALELSGEEKELGRALAWLRAKGLGVKVGE